ncbi:MAG: hypothetical protein H7263_08535 [Candidatus Sericytochromatia bacterium]|nr:hypothetical protein [Candidatus Sericytochromatia bacterium]
MLFAVSAIAATSCKKESEVAPSKNDKSIKMSDDNSSIDKSNVSTWD